MNKIVIHEVGLRDGLQMEKQIVPMEKKIQWIHGLMDAGVDIIQVGSFVHPEKVPQMSDTDKLFVELAKNKTGKAILSGLVLNEKGLERGFNCGVEMFCMGVSASETHSRKNTGMSIAEATERIIAMAKQVETAGKQVQVSVQSAFGCGYEGFVPHERVLGIIRKYLDAGLKRISLADTAGHATPDQVEKLHESVFGLDGTVQCACHFHNTYGMGMVNTYAAMKAGVQNHESSIAGLGGCPFTKIAGGNVCTEDLVHMLHRMNIRKDINLEKLIRLAQDVADFFAREMPGIVYKTGPIEIVQKSH
ncbi:MAG: hydroxymethylglutaryl-CoA lyase [Candidatus Eisenbacteria bacterium]|nr:hydroxymethylglutaryl-CoA lyase [Candidatus Eisenbacteria bacterium]